MLRTKVVGTAFNPARKMSSTGSSKAKLVRKNFESIELRLKLAGKEHRIVRLKPKTV
jgi:hypothetical protein